jgi:hypothetical protein
MPSIGSADAVDHLRRLDPRRFEDGRHDVDDVVELVANAADVLDDPATNRIPWRVPPKCDAICLVQRNGV